jgi:hypothetical protein
MVVRDDWNRQIRYAGPALRANDADGTPEDDLAAPPIGLAPPGPGAYDPYDGDAEAAWAIDVQRRGNVVRWTRDGVFEVDPTQNRVIGPMPTFYRRM